MSLEHNPSV